MSKHVIPPRTYYVVFVALLVLLFLTWYAAQFDLGWLNIPVALAIAVTKMALIMLFFMHLWYMYPVVQMVASAAFLFLGIGALFTFADYLTRSWHAGRITGGGYHAPAIDRVAPGREEGVFVIQPPAQGPPNVTDVAEPDTP